MVSVIGEPAEVLYNASSGGKQWILVDTVCTKRNRHGIGTRIRLTSESGMVQYNHDITSGRLRQFVR